MYHIKAEDYITLSLKSYNKNNVTQSLKLNESDVFGLKLIHGFQADHLCFVV